MNVNGCRCERCGDVPYITTNMSHKELATLDLLLLAEDKRDAVAEAHRAGSRPMTTAKDEARAAVADLLLRIAPAAGEYAGEPTYSGDVALLIDDFAAALTAYGDACAADAWRDADTLAECFDEVLWAGLSMDHTLTEQRMDQIRAALAAHNADRTARQER